MITINMSDKQADILKQLLATQTMKCTGDEFSEMVKEVRTQINNQQFDENEGE